MNNVDAPNDISLDLTLGLHPREEDTVEQQDRSVSNTPNPPHHTSPPGDYIFNGAALPFGAVSLAAPAPYLPSGPQATDARAEVLEVPRRVTTRGRPPLGHQARRNTSRAAAGVDRNVGGKEIVPPYPWATTRPAVIHTLRYLLSKNIKMISGQVHCRQCEHTQTLEYNLQEKFEELRQYIIQNKEVLRQRAPNMWITPQLTSCGSCETGMKPVIGENKEEINWLFLLLGNMLGCCTGEQLRYFCDKTNQHRTGAKDRVLYITYLGLCKQLEPDGPFSL